MFFVAAKVSLRQRELPRPNGRQVSGHGSTENSEEEAERSHHSGNYMLCDLPNFWYMNSTQMLGN
jgi:hypothetical protein